jgi:subtilisin family serine protease
MNPFGLLLPPRGRFTQRIVLCAAVVCLAFSGLRGRAEAATAPGEILVKLRSGDALAPLLTKYGLSLKGRFGARPIFRLVAGPLADLGAIIDALLLEPDVLIAEPNAINGSPEARKNRVWAIGTAQDFAHQWAPAALQLAQAHQISVGSGIRVAVLDTGVDRNHPLLAGRLTRGFDFVDADADPSEEGHRADLGFGHGTHVAGIIAIAAPAASIMPLRVLDAQGQGNAWVLAEAVLYAVDPDGNPATDDGAHVINLSLGSADRTQILDSIARLASCSIPALPDPLEPKDDLSDAGYNADRERCGLSRGAAVLAAAGNDAGIAREYPAAEGAYGLAAVGATSENRRLAPFSNFGSWVHLTAPGDAVTSSVPGGGYGTWSGTSMATPWVAASAALLMSARPAMPPKEAVRQLARTAAPLCGTALRQVDPLAALTEIIQRFPACR